MERRKRRWWTRGITWVSLVVISGALLSGLFQLAVALAPEYRDEMARKASDVLGQPVEVDALALRWRWLWPLLELKGVRLIDTAASAPIVEIERIRLGFDLAELLRGEWVPAEVEVEGAALAAEITPQGQWRLRGRTETRPPPSFDEIAKALKRFSRLRAERVTLAVQDLRDAKTSFSATLQRGDLRLNAQGFELRAELQAPQVLAARLRLRAGMTGDLARPEDWQGRWTLDASGLAPAAPLHRYAAVLAQMQWTDATLTASGDWQRKAPGASELSLRAQALSLVDDPASNLKELDLGLHYRPSPQGGTLDVVPLRLTGRKGSWPTSTARLDWRRETADAPLHWRVSSDFLRLDDLAPWLAAARRQETGPRRDWLRSLRGDLSALEARWQPQAEGASRYSLHARFADAAGRWTGLGSVQGLRGEITADENGGRAQLGGAPVGFELPKLLATAQRATRLEADAQWQREGSGWQLRLPRLDWSLLGSEGRASAEVRLAEGRKPELKLHSEFDVDDVASLKPLMPLRWGQPLKDWLNRAVVRARVARAVLDIEGPVADFPFHKNPTGKWSLLLPLNGARLDYHRDWPGVDQLAATLRFAGNGLSFEAQRGIISGVAVKTAKGHIEDFATAPLVIDGLASGEAPHYYAFLRGSPLASRLQALLRHSEAEGPADTSVHLEIPLHSGLGQKTIARGEVQLKGNSLRHAALDRAVTDITGTLRFGNGPGVSAEQLQARFYDMPVSASIAPNAESSDELVAGTRIDLQAPDGVAARYLPRWLRAAMQGAADWRVAIPLSGPRSGQVRLSSTLAGVGIQLPPPLVKSADEAMPITLDLRGDDSVPLAITGEIAGRLGLALRFARSLPGAPPELQGLNLRLGPGDAPAMPAKDGWRLTAALDRLEPAAWRSVVAAILDRNDLSGNSATDGERLPFLGAALQVQRLHFAGFDTPALSIVAQRESGAITATLQGTGTSGTLRLATAGDALSGRFAALQLQATPRQPGAVALKDGEPLDPARAPTLDFRVDDLHIGGRRFGSLALASERSASGQRLQRLTLEGGIATLKAEGEWRRNVGMTEAQNRFTVTSDDLAGTLESLGYAPTVAGRNAHITGDLTWPAAAGGFDWPLARGSVALSVEDGALRTVEPGGTSRVLGLFNFYALPRRLTLDFGDVVSKGLGFDRVEGRFTLANGVAHTDDLTVRGPSVRVDVRGDVGLAAHDYNQVITVTPNTKGITLGALLLGGASAVAAPVLPLIAVIATQVIDKPLGQVTQLTYRLTGSWDNPEIKKLEPAVEQTPEPEAKP